MVDHETDILRGTATACRVIAMAAAAGLLAVLISACGKPELTRDQAQILIEASPALAEHRTHIALQRDATENGVKLGWLKMAPSGVHSVLPSISGEVSDFWGVSGNGGPIFKVHTPIHVSVTVTGITGDERGPTRVVNFDWRYVDPPPLTRRLALQGGKASAALQRFDDGWRVTGILESSVSEVPFALTAAEKDAYARDIVQEAERKVEAQRKAEEVKREFESKLRLASVPTKVIGQFTFLQNSIYGGNATVHLTVTDVGVEITYEYTAGRRQHTNKQEIKFSSMNRNYQAATPGGPGYYMKVGGVQFLTDQKLNNGLPVLDDVVRAVNQSHEDWKSRFSDIVTSCASSGTWGCGKSY